MDNAPSVRQQWYEARSNLRLMLRFPRQIQGLDRFRWVNWNGSHYVWNTRSRNIIATLRYIENRGFVIRYRPTSHYADIFVNHAEWLRNFTGDCRPFVSHLNAPTPVTVIPSTNLSRWSRRIARRSEQTYAATRNQALANVAQYFSVPTLWDSLTEPRPSRAGRRLRRQWESLPIAPPFPPSLSVRLTNYRVYTGRIGSEFFAIYAVSSSIGDTKTVYRVETEDGRVWDFQPEGVRVTLGNMERWALDLNNDMSPTHRVEGVAAPRPRRINRDPVDQAENIASQLEQMVETEAADPTPEGVYVPDALQDNFTISSQDFTALQEAVTMRQNITINIPDSPEDYDDEP